jgi:peroxiredoxin
VPGLNVKHVRIEDMDGEARRKFFVENHLLSIAAPDWSLQDLDGKPVSLSDFSNKILVLSFVSAEGNVEEPTLKFLQTQYEKYKGKGIAFVCIDFTEKPERQNIKINLERMGVTIPTLTDGSQVARRYNTIEPLIVLIDETGVIRFKNSIWHDYRPFVTEQIEFLLKSKKQ